MTQAGIHLETPFAVWKHLNSEGYKIGKSAVYDHAKAGKLRPNAGGDYTEKEIRAYVELAGLKKKAADEKPSDLQARKAEAEVSRLESQAAMFRHKREVAEGKYIERAQHERDLADRARILKASLTNFFRTHVDDIISLAGGDEAAAPRVLSFCEDRLETWLDAYARAGEITMEPPA